VVTLDYEIKNVLGDIILACGSISYLGAFTMEFRKKILFGRWVPELNNLCIPNSGEKFTLQNILSNPMEIQEWNLCGLPFDSTSVDNVIIMNYQKENIPLVLDPQSQFLKFIKNYEKSKAAEQRRSVVCEKVSVKKLEEKLSNSIRMGDTVILESVGPNISYLFDDLISKKYTLTAGMRCVQVGTQVVEIDRSFKLFLVSNLNNPHYTPDILAKVVFLDFSITPAGLQQQLLSLICKKEEPKDEDEKIIIMKESMDCGIKQKDIELKILKLLNDSKGNVVENDALINSLTESKSTSEDIQLRLKQSAKTEEKIERNRHNYKPLAQLASNIFLIIKELYKWDPMYQFSLKWFESVLLKSITITDKPLVKNPERRVQDLKNSLLYQSYRNICRSVFVKHKQLFSVLLAVTQLKTEDKLDPLVWQLFLTEKGPMDLEKESEEAPEGMNGLRWKKLIELSKVPRFSGLRDYSVKQTAELNSFIDRMEDTQLFEEAVWAKEINSEFDLFSSLTFIKVFRPDLFPKYSQELIRTLLSDKFNEDVVVPLESTFDESSGTKPYIFILAPGDDPQDEIRKYASELGVRVIPISLGRGQGERAKQAIYESCEGNTWILLQNCHLAVAWLPELEGIIEAIGSDAYLKKLHPNFRLFLTAFSTNLFPIGILQDGIKLTKDPPKGIKANMTQIYMAQASSKQEKKFYNEMVETRLDDWRPLFMALCYFHALIRERRRFGPVGWNIPYDFNESDFKISVKQLKYVLNDNSSNSIPFKALIYLTSECYYGGKVTENMDRRLLTTLLAGFYNESAIKDEYFFSEQRTHYIPKIQLTLESALEFLENLPENNHPGLYGLNQNASISSAINETQQMVDNILVINPVSSGSAASQNSNDQVKQLVALLLKKLPSNYDTEEVRTLRPLGYGQCMNTVLIQEVLRYNTLLTEIRSTLTDLKNANEGTIVMTLPLEDMVDKMLKNQIPAQWRKKSYPSLKPMMSYFEDLLQRILMFQTWINTGKPKVYWVSGFFFTQSFFTGVLQDFARKHTVSIDRLSFSHSILQESEAELNAKDEGCYIKGLYLEAARWDAATLSLQESRPKEIFFNMPIVAFDYSRSTSSPTRSTHRRLRQCPRRRSCQASIGRHTMSK
jgi:dynein heavy chain